MKLFQALINLNLLSLSLRAHADNTPDLCTADIPDNLEQIKPSVTYAPWVGEDWANHTLPVPDITVGSETYSGDAEHFVTRPTLATGQKYKRVIIYIPGTTDRPALSSCLIKAATQVRARKFKIPPKPAATPVPIIALSYQYLSSGDVHRNRKCASLATADSNAEQVNCLKEQHVDAIDGGTYGFTHREGDATVPMWGAVDREHALSRRLWYLLTYLHATYPDDGWDNFIRSRRPQIGNKVTGIIHRHDSVVDEIPPQDQEPKWYRMVVAGHSQGAGHAAYLAKTQALAGVAMISGPQDHCDDCVGEDDQFWIDEGPYASRKANYGALGHGDEPLYDVQLKNWEKMTAAAGGKMGWSTAHPDGFVANVGQGYKTTPRVARAHPLRTDLAHFVNSTCGGKEHCSTAIDDSVPFLENTAGEKYYLYEATVWPALFHIKQNEAP